MNDAVEQLQQEFSARQAALTCAALAKQRRNRRNGTIAGAITAMVAVATSASVTRKAWFWHSFLLEMLFCGLAGYLLARAHGGALKGLLLFSGAYLLAFCTRASGFDPSVVFAAADLRRGIAVQGNFMSLCMMVSVGGLLGHVMTD